MYIKYGIQKIRPGPAHLFSLISRPGRARRGPARRQARPAAISTPNLNLRNITRVKLFNLC